MSITHQTVYGIGGGYLVVRDADYDRARTHLDRYEEENRNFPPRRRVERTRYMGPPLVAIAFLLLVAFAWVTGPAAKPNGAWFREGASVASLVLTSEPFRAVTALTLHADGAHVLSNLVSGAIFGRAVERRFGPGAALFGIVTAGTLGNVANAMFFASQGMEHRSIGASTAVFGAVGLLATSQLILGGTRAPMTVGRTGTSQEGKRHWTEYLAPVIGGIALLGALGSGPETDVLAHAFGLVAGLFVGIPIALAIRHWHKSFVWRRGHIVAQAALGAIALGAVGASWALAL
ncbi:MAG: rhomboid family intramembrane serine protease [Polyangiaceae bacterium]|nr:rhomboid family intramembrane serine protease [Polyangiaceae bacterium]